MNEPNVFSPPYSLPASPSQSQPRASSTNSSGLTLVLPSLKTLKTSKNSKKSAKNRADPYFAGNFQDADFVEKKPLRPIKLKPLKEVLTKLIAQIKKKDDYAFFLRPVDPEQVPGYTDVINHPMDLGTMSTKVERGKYRSLEEFASDLRLVASNAKTFNPPGSIYHTEAERIEAWGLDHIAKAAPTVIQYETDWNIDIERDDDTHAVDIDNDDDASMEVEESVLDGRSASVVSQPVPGPSRRGPRGPYKKGTHPGVSENIEHDGHLPGAKDGLGMFPPGSDLAQLVLSLKLKGKRYRTKKERMRIEKEGPPMLPEGSLDYSEMEDPFSVLSVFVPEPASRPFLTPLYPPLAAQSATTNGQPSGSSTPQLQQLPRSIFPTATAAPLTYSFSLPQPSGISASTSKKRHWTITRNPIGRSNKGKERDEDVEQGEIPAWQMPREAHAADFGSFALLAGELTREMQRRGISLSQGTGAEGEEQEVLDTIRNTLDCESGAKAASNGIAIDLVSGPDTVNGGGGLFYPNDYWNLKRATEAEEYIRDIVYGGVDGLAYVRSLAEYLTTYYSEDSPTTYQTNTVFGMSLAAWVEREIVQPLTGGRHALLQRTAEQVYRVLSATAKGLVNSVPLLENDGYVGRGCTIMTTATTRSIPEQVYLSLNVYPPAMVALSALLQIKTHKIDMGALIKAPEELFQSEEEWAGKLFKERRRNQGTETGREPLSLQAQNPTKGGGTAVGIEGQGETATPWTSQAQPPLPGREPNRNCEIEGPEELKEVLNYVADVIVAHNHKIRKARVSAAVANHQATRAWNEKGDLRGDAGLEEYGMHDTQGVASLRIMKGNDGDGLGKIEKGLESELEEQKEKNQEGQEEEEPTLRNIRLNLLALAKRAPLDTIARLPKDLVPEHIRRFVPTLGNSS
ncbi:hypothetical protein AMATHDRAFT_54825 [Amanita thiersii Skay4041]|uniref:Bromo domain-containing protein n=1 Tax=Amanita thiersii Skay4041 TaxID=703135 RepID=A0A2A9NZR2_9AGAR|nr:hypothetical protein AMATHDRAFT_54825 [Amanita thiersii Skay4041]